MPSTSVSTATRVADYGVAEDRSAELDGYAVNFVTIKQTHDLAPMLAALPGGNCTCPHWGYVFKGTLTVRYADHEETFRAGDAFYMPPGPGIIAETIRRAADGSQRQPGPSRAGAARRHHGRADAGAGGEGATWQH
jgi:hypothetical protein